MESRFCKVMGWAEGNGLDLGPEELNGSGLGRVHGGLSPVSTRDVFRGSLVLWKQPID